MELREIERRPPPCNTTTDGDRSRDGRRPRHGGAPARSGEASEGRLSRRVRAMTSAIDGRYAPAPEALRRALAHPTRVEERGRAARYVLDTARQLGLPARQDAAGNVLVEKPATAGGNVRRRLPPVAPRHGVREERGHRARLHDGPDPAAARGRRAATPTGPPSAPTTASAWPRRWPWRTIPRWCTGRSSCSSPSTRRPASPGRSASSPAS